jgi:hypothetical protein
MIKVEATTLELSGVRLEQMAAAHAEGLAHTAHDTMCSILAGEWPEIRAHLHYKLAPHA